MLLKSFEFFSQMLKVFSNFRYSKIFQLTLWFSRDISSYYKVWMCHIYLYRFKRVEPVIRRCSVKKVFLDISQKFIGKRLYQSLFFNKVAGLKPTALLIKSLWHRCFPVNFAKFLRAAFLTNHPRWLLLNLEFFIKAFRLVVNV